MVVRKMKALKALALFLVFCFAQVYVQAGLGDPGGGGMPQGARLITARLTTSRGLAVIVSGNSLASGATILTGATIETPDQVSATVDLGPLGTLDIGPNSKVQLDFDDGGAKVKLLKGCAAFKSKGNSNSEISTEQGASEKTSKSRRSMSFCFVGGQLSPGSVSGATAAGGAAGAGLGTGAIVAIVAGAGVTVAVLVVALNGGTGRGANPSP